MEGCQKRHREVVFLFQAGAERQETNASLARLKSETVL